MFSMGSIGLFGSGLSRMGWRPDSGHWPGCRSFDSRYGTESKPEPAPFAWAGGRWEEQEKASIELRKVVGLCMEMPKTCKYQYQETLTEIT